MESGLLIFHSNGELSSCLFLSQTSRHRLEGEADYSLVTGLMPFRRG